MLIVRRFGEGWAKSHIAAAMGISRKCVHTWIARYQAEGDVGRHDRSSRPHTMPHKTPEAVEDLIVELRTLRRCGPDGIGAELGVPARTVSRVLRRHQVPYLRDCDPMTGELIRASKTTALRYERDRPGELVHMDVKKLGRIPDGGWRAHGHTDVPDRKRKQSNGFDYVHSVVDDHSRLAYSEILPDEKGVTCAGFLSRAAAYFRDRGIDHIERVMTDNVWAYLNRTLTTEWAYRQAFTTNFARTTALAPWLDYYNTQRRQSALGGQPPISRLRPT
jgi:transposase